MKQSKVVSPAQPVLTEERLNDLRRQRQNDIFPCVVVYGKELDALLAMAASVGEMRELLRRCNEAALRAYDEGAGLPQYGWYTTDKVGRRQHWWNDGDGIDAALERKAE